MFDNHRKLISGVILTAAALSGTISACSTPASIEIEPKEVTLEGADAELQLEAKILDSNGEVIPDGHNVVFFSDGKNIKCTTDGKLTAVSSGEAEVEVVNTEIKTAVPVRIKIPSSIRVSHEKLRLWSGQVKENVWAEVRSEKDAFIEGYLPEWSSDDPSIVKVEPIVDPKRRQSWVKMTGLKSGTTYINASFKSIKKTIRVAVFDEDEEVALDGTRIPKDAT